MEKRSQIIIVLSLVTLSVVAWFVFVPMQGSQSEQADDNSGLRIEKSTVVTITSKTPKLTESELGEPVDMKEFFQKEFEGLKAEKLEGQTVVVDQNGKVLSHEGEDLLGMLKKGNVNRVIIEFEDIPEEMLKELEAKGCKTAPNWKGLDEAYEQALENASDEEVVGELEVLTQEEFEVKKKEFLEAAEKHSTSQKEQGK